MYLNPPCRRGKIRSKMKSNKKLKETEVREKYLLLKDYLDERSGRVWAATEIRQLGKGGKSIVKRATGLDYKTLNKGLEELEQNKGDRLDRASIRKSGGGRKKTPKKTRP